MRILFQVFFPFNSSYSTLTLCSPIYNNDISRNVLWMKKYRLNFDTIDTSARVPKNYAKHVLHHIQCFEYACVKCVRVTRRCHGDNTFKDCMLRGIFVTGVQMVNGGTSILIICRQTVIRWTIRCRQVI